MTKINLEKLVRLVGFIKKKFVMMHGHVKVKLPFLNFYCSTVNFDNIKIIFTNKCTLLLNI